MRWVFTRIHPAEFLDPKPPSGQPKVDRPVWNKATSTLGRSDKILPIKEIGYSQEGRHGLEYPKPRFVLRWPHPLLLYQLIEVRRPTPNQTFDREWHWTPRPGCRQTEVGEVTPAESNYAKSQRREHDNSSGRSWRLTDSRLT